MHKCSSFGFKKICWTIIDYAEWKIFNDLGKFFFQISNGPFIIAYNSFSKIWSINSNRDGFISQNIKIYLAYTV